MINLYIFDVLYWLSIGSLLGFEHGLPLNHLMELLDFILHVDQHLAEFITNYGTWIYGILFLIILSKPV